MTTPEHDLDLKYAKTDCGTRGEAEFTLGADPHRVTVSGRCPRCEGETGTDFPRGVAGTKGWRFWAKEETPSPAGRSAVVGAEVLYCECGFAHEGMPETTGFEGCGAYWRIGPGTGGTP
ncbi:hypothetical protein GTW40_17655 [Streptomyces sp. SID4985]|uniref:hypothetical protein n=1 Tax=Streptomyces sp. SID4985 TaxID=2690292 RepID=UPI00136FC07B|nr:hypothetical protein [Streptomyces sp. SID4985]MYQ46860.1 hypothetical protein [Streptomyces sp. SID4985]